MTEKKTAPRIEQKPVKSEKVVGPREAVEAAVDYYVSATGEKPGFVLEELEQSSDSTKWLVTLSHKDPSSAVFALYPGASDGKLYKVFTVDAVTGKVASMKAKKL